MPITRAKASSLLNRKEMELYDDSRINGLRQLDAKGLGSRIKRARTARDRARDLVQKHKLASRAQTGNKRGTSGQANQRSKDKATLTADILQRFERRLKDVEREAGSTTSAAGLPARKAKTGTTKAKAGTKAAGKVAPARRAAPAKTAAKKATAKKATGKKATGKKTAGTKAARNTAGPTSTGKRAAPAKNTATGTRKAPAKTSSAAKSTRKRTARKASRKRHITPEQALAQTQALLEAKQAKDVAPRPWQDLPTAAAAGDGQPGYQSDAAKRRALRLHAAEARIPAIQGSVSTRDRINQGKRDHRGDGNGE